ncbi:hypothetical protein OOU_Y34scaffold00548g2 [Pyricularia oryzae Y34]|uniref:Uncharacterized protein n=2 Tax=Pyricularia oryzae TaxID=318829 RepID=A0AA97NXM2_PYRO3|nr:hypothetical protein OOU_Y34scaffold00548g2 [Pyricularia oryzae Y34]
MCSVRLPNLGTYSRPIYCKIIKAKHLAINLSPTQQNKHALELAS